MLNLTVDFLINLIVGQNLVELRVWLRTGSSMAFGSLCYVLLLLRLLLSFCRLVQMSFLTILYIAVCILYKIGFIYVVV